MDMNNVTSAWKKGQIPWVGVVNYNRTMVP